MFLEETSRTLAAKGDVDMAKSLVDQTEAFYERAVSGIMSDSMLLHFAYADFQEQQSKHDKVHQIYLKFLENKDIDPTLCYIQYMKFCRRAEGTGSARTVFKKAREDARTQHHVFISAALMEYYCTKDKKIAGNVFELGFKKYKTDQQYVLEYIQYLSHLNEDNNTRVLFERALSSGSLSSEDSVEVWNKFLEFESAVGDLPGIVKVEKRRAQALDQAGVMTVGAGATARLIDRYRFKDLYPCSVKELRCMGYQTNDEAMNKLLYPATPATASANSNMAPNAGDVKAEGGANVDARNGSVAGSGAKTSKDSQGGAGNKAQFPRPDTSQMVPFKPKFKWFAGEHRLPGGGFPIPQAAAELCQKLPPPQCFQGPFVIVDRLVESFMSMQLANEFIVPRFHNNGHSARLFDTASSNAFNADLAAMATNNRAKAGAANAANAAEGGDRGGPSSSTRKDASNRRERSSTPGGAESGGSQSKRRRGSREHRGGGSGGRGGRNAGPGSDDDDNDSNLSAPINDIYRQRQQNRMR